MGDYVLRLHSVEIALGAIASANTVSNAALVRLFANTTVTVFVANGYINSTSTGTNTGSFTIPPNQECYVQKYPADVLFYTNATAAVVNATSVAFRD